MKMHFLSCTFICNAYIFFLSRIIIEKIMKIHHLYALFLQDLGIKDRQREKVFLVIQVVRVGKCYFILTLVEGYNIICHNQRQSVPSITVYNHV